MSGATFDFRISDDEVIECAMPLGALAVVARVNPDINAITNDLRDKRWNIDVVTVIATQALKHGTSEKTPEDLYKIGGFTLLAILALTAIVFALTGPSIPIDDDEGSSGNPATAETG